MTEQVRLELTIAAPLDEVWRALRDPAALRDWWGWEYDGLEAEIATIHDEHAEADDAARVVRWATGDRIALEARGDETVLRLVRPAPAGATSWDDVYDELDRGWIAFVLQLRFYAERHRGQRRRTLYLAGTGAPPTQALGVPADADPGERYAAGEDLTGDVWFRSRDVTALTVDGFGDGLAVLLSPPGEGKAILSAYGLDDDAFAGWRDRWTAWWRGRYADVEVVSGAG